MKWNSSLKTKLRVAYAKLGPFVEVTETDNGDILSGFMPQILESIAVWMNLELSFFREPRDQYGTFTNNTWNGMIGMLYRNEVDLILNPILPYDKQLDFLYFTNPITIEAFTILSGKKSTEAGLFLYFSVLDKSVWIGIIVALLVISLASAVLFRSAVLPYHFNLLNTTGRYCWNLMSYMLKQVPSRKLLLRKNKHVSSFFVQVLVMSWIICIAFLVMSTFQSLLVTKMTLKKYQPVVETLAELASSKDCICLAPREIEIDPVIRDSPVEAIRRSWTKVNARLSNTRVLQEDKLHDVEGGRFCIIHGHLILEDRLSRFYTKHGSCNLHLSRKYFYPFSLLMAVSKKKSLAFYETFNFGITRLVDADITGRWFKPALKVSDLCTSYSDNTLKALGLQNIYGVLLLWVAGLTFALVALLIEISISKYKKKNRSVRVKGNTRQPFWHQKYR